MIQNDRSIDVYRIDDILNAAPYWLAEDEVHEKRILMTNKKM